MELILMTFITIIRVYEDEIEKGPLGIPTMLLKIAFFPLRILTVLMKLVLPVEILELVLLVELIKFHLLQNGMVMTRGIRSNFSSMAGGYVDFQSKEVHSEDMKKYGLQRKTTYLEGVKEEDLMVTEAIHKQLNLHLRHWWLKMD
ncbi:hypothetical protein Tco_0413376 [Tanacetum coccineum]